MYDKLNEIHLDVLKEIGNIGIANAVTSISTLLDQNVRMSTPVVNLVEFKHIADYVGGPENILVGILVGITGEIKGMMMFLMRMNTAREMVDAIMRGMPQEHDENTFNEIELSAIQEIGNILAGSYLGSLSNFTNLAIRSSVPMLAIDMANALLSVPAIEFGKVADHVLYIESALTVELAEVSSYFILVPDQESFQRIMQSLGVETA